MAFKTVASYFEKKTQFHIWDTNAYRSIVTHHSEDEIEKLFRELREKEDQKGIIPLICPIPCIELTAHIAYAPDSAFAICLSALTAISLHTENRNNEVNYEYIADSDANLANALFPNKFKDFNSNTFYTDKAQAICQLPNLIKQGQRNQQIELINEIKSFVDRKEEEFINFMIDDIKAKFPQWENGTKIKNSIPTQQQTEKQKVDNYFSDKSKKNKDDLRRDLADNLVIRAAKLCKLPSNELDQKIIEVKRQFILDKFPTVIELYHLLFTKAVKDGKFVNIKNFGNCRWDEQLAFYIGNANGIISQNDRKKGEIIVITKDGEIENAAKNAGLDNKVIDVETHLKNLGINYSIKSKN